MADDGSRAGIEVIRSGVLGEVQRAARVDRPRRATWWPQGVDRPAETPPAPKIGLGFVARRRGRRGLIIPAYCPFIWRGWKDFGTGPIGDMGIHNAAVPFAALRLGPPESVKILETSGLKSETFPIWSRLRCRFPASGRHKPVALYWYDGGQKPPETLIGGKLAGNGAIVVGSEGTLYSAEWTGGDWHLFPEEKFRDYKRPQPTLPAHPGRTITWNGSRPAKAAALPSATSSISQRR